MENQNVYEKENKIEILAMGIDFSNDFSQISYLGTSDNEPVSMSTLKGEKRYLIPTVLYKKREIDEWCIGDEANQRFYDDINDKQTINDIMSIIDTKREVLIEGKFYTPSEIVYIYFRELLNMAKNILNIGKIHELVVTIEKADKDLVEYIYSALENYGLKKKNVRVLTHSESFIYYTINQPKMIWVNDVALFDFNKDHFTYKSLSVTKNKNPNIVYVYETDYSKMIDYNMILESDSREKADIKFYEIICEEFRKHVTSGVFLTGVGFNEDWTKKSLTELCNRRRVFKGYNLLVKGACYAAMKKYKKITSIDHIFQCEGRTKAGIGIMIDNEGRNILMSLSNPGTNWYEAGAKVECILDNVKQIQLIFKGVVSDITRKVVIDLSGFPERPNKTTRVSISVAYINANTCEIEVKDLGFGDFYKATDAVVREIVEIDDILI